MDHRREAIPRLRRVVRTGAEPGCDRMPGTEGHPGELWLREEPHIAWHAIGDAAFAVYPAFAFGVMANRVGAKSF